MPGPHPGSAVPSLPPQEERLPGSQPVFLPPLPTDVLNQRVTHSLAPLTPKGGRWSRSSLGSLPAARIMRFVL